MTNAAGRILIVGGGPAGAVTAWWLGKAGFDVVVAERSTKGKFALGQGIDITGPAINVIEKMGLDKRIRASTTGEEGFAMADDNGKEIGRVGQKTAEGQGFTATEEIEITRRELCTLLAEAAEEYPNVSYRYSCSLSGLQQNGKSVKVTLSDSSEAEEFACIIGADGLGSKVRTFSFDSDAIKDCYNKLDVYVAFFSMPGNPETDLPNSRCQQSTGGRTILLRPADEKAERTSCYMSITHDDSELDDVSANGTIDQQKDLLLDRFNDIGGLAEQATKGLKETEDLYCTRIVQVKLPTWHSGRCALVGDAAYGPSPLTGEGTTLGLVGAYVLAGELAADTHDPPAAFAKYRETLEAYVTKAQGIPLGGKAPQIANPQTSAGIWTLRTAFKVVSWTGLWKLIGAGSNEKDAFKLPDYDFSQR